MANAVFFNLPIEGQVESDVVIPNWVGLLWFGATGRTRKRVHPPSCWSERTRDVPGVYSRQGGSPPRRSTVPIRR
jgi:hypothetical protein